MINKLYHPTQRRKRAVMADKLEAVRNLIIEEQHWIKGKYARDEKGKVVDPSSPAACQWCLLGAIYKAIDKYEDKESAEGYIRTVAAYKYNDLATFNDQSSHKEVIAALDCTIEALGGKNGRTT